MALGMDKFGTKGHVKGEWKSENKGARNGTGGVDEEERKKCVK